MIGIFVSFLAISITPFILPASAQNIDFPSHTGRVGRCVQSIRGGFKPEEPVSCMVTENAKKVVISIQNDQNYNIEFHTADEGKTYARIDLDEGMIFTQYSKYAGERTIILLY